MRALLLAALLAMIAASGARAEDTPYGSLDFSRLTAKQSDFFWRRLRSLAIEEAVLSYCGKPDDFETLAKQGIRACVTSEAMGKAVAFFKAQEVTALASLHERKASCRGKPEAQRGWLGVEIKPDAKGALVTAAMAGSPAAAADLKAGDVIASVNGQAISGPKQLSAKIRAMAAGATVARWGGAARLGEARRHGLRRRRADGARHAGADDLLAPRLARHRRRCDGHVRQVQDVHLGDVLSVRRAYF
jgi:hypothetical protein